MLENWKGDINHVTVRYTKILCYKKEGIQTSQFFLRGI